QKESALQESLAKLGLKEVPGADFDPTKLPAVTKAKLQVDNAKSKMKRGKQLHDQTPPLISDQDYADLVNAWDIAKSAYDAEVLVARGLASEAKTRAADLAIANQALSDTTVRAPRITYPAGISSSGQPMPDDSPRSADIHASKKNRSYVVVGRMASVAELEKAVTPMFRLVDDDPVKLRANVPERYV